MLTIERKNTGGPGNIAFDREEAARLRSCGYSLAEVADELGVRKQSVHEALRRLGRRQKWTLQAARLRHGMSQYGLARAFGVPRGSLALWEQGRRAVPLLRRGSLAALLGLAVNRIEWGDA